MQDQQAYIDRIKNSQAFARTSTSRALLQYLFDETIKGSNLKEGVIEMEFFKKLDNNDKNNARVRVSIYNLRKKLQKYYEEEGKNDDYYVSIEKGQYIIKFIKQDKPVQLIKKRALSQLIPYAVMLITISISLMVTLPPKQPSLWQGFLSKNTPTTLYIGDLFGYYGQTIAGKTGWIRDFHINNEKELYQLKEKHPELNYDLRPAKYTLTTSMAVLSTQDFQSLFQAYNKELHLKFSSQTTISDIKEGNAIYAGPLKNQNPFIYFFNNGNPYFKIENNTLFLSKHPSINDSTFNLFSKDPDTEYAVVSRVSGTDETHHFMFFSNHDMGVKSTVEYFTNKDLARQFKKQYLSDYENFTAIFKVKGKDRTNTDLELVLVVGF